MGVEAVAEGLAPARVLASGRSEGDILTLVAKRFVAVHKRHRGRGPDRIRVTCDDSTLTVELHQDTLPMERTLLAGGKRHVVETQRAEYESMIETELRVIVEEATGRPVSAFLHAGHYDPNLHIEMFVFGPQTSPDVSEMSPGAGRQG